MINGRLHREMIYKGNKILIDACELEAGRIEVMTLYTDGARRGEDIESVIVSDIDEAEKAWNGMRFKYEHQEEAELKGKYAKLRDDLIKAIQAGKEADQGEDGGTCNFDAPAIVAPRWREKLVLQAAKEAGTSAWKWNSFGETKFVFSPPTSAQANRRVRVGAAMCKTLSDCGYEICGYSSMD